MEKPIVWVVKEQAKRDGLGNTVPMDYTAAYKFGEVKFITQFDLPATRGSSMAEQWFRTTTQFATDYDPNRDYIILTGAPLAIFMVGMVLAAANKMPRILVWRREVGLYVIYDPNAEFALL